MSTALIIADSIAIKFLENVGILTGVGNELHCHLVATDFDERVVRKSHVLPIRHRAKIHGIVVGKEINADKILLFGEKEFCLVKWTPKLEFTKLYRSALTDWISAATFLKDSTQFILATAHSVLSRFHYREATKTFENCQLIEIYSCTDKSTLYCSYIHGDTWNELVVFGGNAFGELLIWQPKQCFSINDNGKERFKLLHRISAHNGVIFSIHYDGKFELLVTTSDDRSIRFWRLKTHNSYGWSRAKLTRLASGFGHVARVFQGKVISVENRPYAITVGEDSNFCVWTDNGELIFKRHHQFGAVIWNFEFDNETKTLFTVGSTGNLLAYGLQDVFHQLNAVDTMNIKQIECSESIEYVTKIKYLRENILIGISRKNCLVFYQLFDGTDKITEWQEVSDILPFKCTVFEVFEDVVAIGGHKRIILYKYRTKDNTTNFIKLYDDVLLNGVVRFFNFLSLTTFLICDEYGNCLLIKGSNMENKYQIEICKECCLTAAISIDNDDRLLLLSNRQGNLLLYEFDTKCENYKLKSILKKPHGHLGATIFKLMESTKNKVLVKSAGRDGSVKLLCIDKVNLTISIHSRHLVPVAWIVALITIENREVLLGFNDNHFVGWSNVDSFTMKVRCGGGHRSWHYFLYNEIDNQLCIKLVFIRNTQILFYKAKLFNEVKSRIILPSRNMWHVRSCNIVKLIKTEISNKFVLISAGDDNIIKISIYNKQESKNQLTQMAEIHSHISNIRALKVIQLDQNYSLIFSGGGRAQLCISKLNMNKYIFEELLNYTLSTASNQTKESYKLDPETRIMAIDVIRNKNSTELFIYLGCSDGYARKIILDDQFVITSIKKIFFGRCLLQVHVVGDTYLLIAGTDGVLKFFDLDLNQNLFSLSHHCSGVNALDVLTDASKQNVHIITGGDDQSVVYTNFHLSKQNNAKIIKTIKFKDIHTAQVTAASINIDDNGCPYAFTSGVDQILCKINLETEFKKVYYSCVADIKGLCAVEQQICFIYGSGLQIFDLTR